MINRIFITGDTHGGFSQFDYLVSHVDNLTKNDVLIVLGDSAIRFEGENSGREKYRKIAVSKYPFTFFILRGNHDRPYTIGNDVSLIKCPLLEDDNPMMWHDPNYSNIWYFQDGEIYNINNQSFLTVGGAYSIDKYYRLSMHYTWYKDEQLDEYTRKQITEKTEGLFFNYVLTHTCPKKWEPIDLFLNGINQDQVDKTMETWLDKLSNSIQYKNWYFGHYHDDRIINSDKRARMFFKDVVEIM